MTLDEPTPIDNQPGDLEIRRERLHVLASALEDMIRVNNAIEHGWFISVLLKILPPAKPFPSDCLEDVLACVRHTELQFGQDEAAARAKYRVKGGSPEDFWIFFETPPKTWKSLGGRAGWLVLCPMTFNQRAFFLTAMN